MVCPACGEVAPSGARFCASCGQSLLGLSDERRVVTVLFADIVGFTTLSERLDPELVKNLVDRCFSRLAQDVTAFGGRVDKIIGDAMLALFGAPTAHEDDAERAVRAALRMQETLCSEVESFGHDIEIRIAVNTGEVLVGAIGAAGSITAMGDVVNTASRLQVAAGAGEVVVGPATYAATHRTIAYEGLGLTSAKGREEPVETWRAISPVLPPGYRARREGVHLVGRDHEMGILQNAVHASITHQRAVIVFLLGDVGLGKSRLADEVAARAATDHRAVVREGRCVPYGEANVWWPVADALRGALGLEVGDDRERAMATLRQQVSTTLSAGSVNGADAEEVERTAKGLLTLMGYDPPADEDATAVIHNSARALSAYAEATANRRPLVMQISDLHFADDVVLHLIDDVMAHIHHLPVVVLATARPNLLERWSPRPGRHNSLVFHLDPLDRAATGELLEALSGGPVAEEITAAFHERSGGNPFYVEELVSLLDRPEHPGGPSRLTRAAAFPETLPDTLRGLVAARLDDLDPSVRAVLQDAAVLGSRGTMEALGRMAAQLGRAVDVADAVAQLVSDEIMRLDGQRWSFRSDLVREVAYQTITKTDRAVRHFGIAWYMEHHVALDSPRPVWVADQLAHHYAEAATLARDIGPLGTASKFPPDLDDRARRWVVEVAKRAKRDLALPTARRHYNKALELLGPDLDARAEEVIPLLLDRASLAVELWDTEAARRDVADVQRLADQVGAAGAIAKALVLRGLVEQREGDSDAAIATLTTAADAFLALRDPAGCAHALRERAMVQILTGRIEDAELSARDALGAFVEAGDKAGQGWAHQNLAWINFVTTRTAEAEAHAQAAIDHFTELDDQRGSAWAWGVMCWIRFQQGRVDEAALLGEGILSEAQDLGDPWAIGMTRLLVASVRLWTGDTADAVRMASESLAGFQELDDAYGLGQASAVLGRAMVMNGAVQEGLDLLHTSGNPAGGHSGESGPAGGQVSRIALLATAVQLGQPELSEDLIAEIAPFALAGSDEICMALGMHSLQQGDLDLAAGHLFRHEGAPPSANLRAGRALVAALTSRPGTDVDVEAAAVDAAEGATYLDRALIAMAKGVRALRYADAPGVDVEALRCSAHDALRSAMIEVEGTGDLVARATFGLVAAGLEDALGFPQPGAGMEAEAALDALGIDARGWRRILDLATAATVA